MSQSNDAPNVHNLRSRVYEIIKFIFAGGSSTGVNLLTFFLLADVMRVWYIGASVLAFCSGFIVHFFIQRYIVFPASKVRRVEKQFGAFFAAALFNLMSQVVGIYVLVEYCGIMPLIAQVIMLGLLAILNFLLYKYLIFKV